MWYAYPLIYLLCLSSAIWAEGNVTGPICYICGDGDGRCPEWKEPHCMDAVGGKYLVSTPVRYYRRTTIRQALDKRSCLEYCAAESTCAGVEWFKNTNTCYDIFTTYEKGRIPTEGPVKFKGFTCFTISSPLTRLKRAYISEYHRWNAENNQNSGICLLATTAAQGCTTMVQVGSQDNDSKLNLNRPHFAGYCMHTPGDCGATELVVRYYRHITSGPNWFYTTMKVEYENTQDINNNYMYEEHLCYVWPGYPNINCEI